MSLETDVANLVTKTTTLIDYFNGKKAGIDAAVAAAVAAVPETSRTWYVDQVSGLDTNLGSKSSPFKSIEKAIKSTPAAGSCTVNLMGDYTLDYLIVSTCAYLFLYGGLLATAPKLRAGYYQTTDAATGVKTTQLGGFLLMGQASSIELRQVDPVLPAATGVTPTPTSIRLCSLIRTNAGSNLPPLVGVTLSTLTVSMDSTFAGALVGISTSSVVLNCTATTFPSDFGGKYIGGVASGTEPKTLNNVLTNLSAL
ncbi:hypothetical protein ACIQUS_04285 [Pseudomonas sp. NPDC090755]|uniref:hypothetical protein n=1 Tax=Pseudomonas sp. NPDC090755 TaxID=3364481 RepID=UPI003839D53F